MTNRYSVRTIAFVLLLALMGLALVSCGPGSVKQAGQQSGLGADPTVAPYGAFPGLEGIPQDQLFDHFLSGQFQMTDKNGTPFTINMTPGTVDSINTTSITIIPNGQTTTQTFNVTPDTIVRAEPGRGSIAAVVKGDKIVVITRDTSMDAILIAKHGPTFHRRLMQSIMME